jgi:hypothetical protein
VHEDERRAYRFGPDVDVILLVGFVLGESAHVSRSVYCIREEVTHSFNQTCRNPHISAAAFVVEFAVPLKSCDPKTPTLNVALTAGTSCPSSIGVIALVK